MSERPMSERWWLEGWFIPKNMKQQEGPRVFKLMGTRSYNGHTTWVLRMFTIERAAHRNLLLRHMYRREARRLRKEKLLTFINY